MSENPTRQPGFIRHVPNMLTIARLGMTAVILGLILYAPQTGQEKPANLLLGAFILFVIAGLTDIVDGHIARRFNATSKFGRTVDPLADKVLVCGAFICFAIVGQPRLANFHFPEWAGDAIRWAVAAILLLREVVVQTLRHIAESRGVNFGAVVWGKVKMFLQSFGIGTVLIGWAYVSRPWGDWFTLITFGLMAAVTVISGIDALKRPIK
ncbi:MAG: CDP-alcohol phosphatidyltransferase family protein [Sedimentisphaerales bacterium]|nr:CDP-alcohol phosphatidyltransferase family protein [Sedimentisphaerales bacterium]